MSKKKAMEIVCSTLETDELEIMGIGTARLKGYSVITRVPLKELQKAINILKALHSDEENPAVDIAIADDYPLCLGTFNKKNNTIAGVLIAPRDR